MSIDDALRPLNEDAGIKEKQELEDIYREVLRAARYLLRNRPLDNVEAEDLAQDIALRFLERKLSLPPEEELRRPYLMAMTRNSIFDHVRRQHSHKRGGNSETVSLDNIAISTAPSMELKVILSEGLEHLDRLDPRAASALNLSFVGFSATEIGEQLGVTRRTVERDIACGRLFLQRFLEKPVAKNG